MNLIFLAIVLAAFGTAAWRQARHVPAAGVEAPMQALSSAMMASAGGAVELALGLVGVMTLFLGLMKVAEAGGLLVIIARLIRPLMTRMFPEVPADHPAMGAMILNLSANALGLGNAATPFGVRAMQELERLNPRPGTATDSMALFLAINTSGVTLLPTGVIAIRAAAGSADPAAILPTTLFATVCATIAAIAFAFALRRFFPAEPLSDAEPPRKATPLRANPGSPDADPLPDSGTAYPLWVSLLALGAIAAAIPASIVWGRTISPWIMPLLMLGFLLFGALRGVRVYEVFVDGAREGFQVALRIIPYLVAILVAVGMLRASGALDAMVGAVGGFTGRFGLPAEALPMALLRPLSGSGAYAVMVSIIENPATGPDTYVGYLVTTLQGSSETTFYVLAVYFGAVQVRRMRHTLAAALLADAVAVIASVAICSYLFAGS
ncbi:nucleoside recognition domain-containing protein [Quisquiliibacterium transsilvanicum]|uniref:Spore maturation protein SpmA/spore maturation protein SpmB n=1 Tax=Quisquiliibacterium transsilvanicum TaxID=1549638 RepID=A0A7W8HEA2_9BURK|nr:nucleoside recognition domain-containing protein [Quisquiliibacterium transsilvanicum]MBB5270376.1 spore maturation protein SpmA/spore maturation protein SpmB [Quisquiliibacterium transsilvanicum]